MLGFAKAQFTPAGLWVVAFLLQICGSRGNPVPDDLSHKYAIPLLWDGGQANCVASSCSAFFVHMNTSACSDGDGHWNNGIKTFMDPLPAVLAKEFILSQVDLEIKGVFDCISSGVIAPTSYTVSLQGSPIVTAQGSKYQRTCLCRNCVDQFNAESPEFPVSGWPNYTYSGNNSLQVQVTANFLCLSEINVVLTFTRSYYPPTSSTGSGSDSGKGVSKELIIWGFVAVGIAVGLACAVLLIYFVMRVKKRKGYTPIGDNTGGSGAGAFPINGFELVLGQKIGKGSYGDVYQAEWRKIQVAVKKINIDILKNDEFMEDFTKETSIMGSLRHPNVLQFLGTCFLDRDLCLITEFMSNGSVYKLLHSDNFNFHWNLLKKFALDAAHGMIYLHRCEPPVIHRDLKSHNLLVDDSYKLKISDFGLSRILDVKESALTSCGTPAWAAPEVLRNQKYSAKADVYSFAICLWEFFTKLDPYEGMPTFQIIFAVGTSGLRPTIPDSCPPDYAQLIRDCWDADPSRRPDFEEIVERLKDLE